jgi:AraC-like DNA-binding protein
MDKIIQLKQAEDFFSFIVKNHVFTEEKYGREYHYIIADKYGSGYINRVILENGVTINIADVMFYSDLRLHYRIEQPPFEISYMISGDLLFFDNDINYIMRMRNGDINITFKNYTEGWIQFQGNQHYRSISIYYFQPLSKILGVDEDSAEEMNNCMDVDSKLINSMIIPQKINPILQVPFAQIRERNVNSLARFIYLESKAKEIIALAIENNMLNFKESASKIKLNKSDVGKIHLVKKILIENMENPLSILELSKTIGINTYKLKVGFKELFGTTVFGYLRDIRMEKARLLLENYELNINEIANEVGYSNPSHFAAAFRKKYGITPGCFRF